MVDVNTQNKTISVNVSSSGVSSNVSASGDASQYYSEKAREWAISNRIVDGVDYSSKYYAGSANQSALNAQSFAQSALETLNNVDNKVQEATENIEIQKQDVITEIEDLSEQEQNKIVDLGIDTRANVDLSNLSEQGQAKFDEKANVADVLNKSDKSEISGWGMPTNEYINLTVGASGTTYTAPANGYYQCYIGGSSGNKWLKLSTTGGYLQEAGFSTSNNIGFTIPIQKGQILYVSYSGTLTAKSLRFFYAQGEV